MIATILISALVVAFFAYHLLLVCIENYRAHKFFRTKSPQLPVVPNPNILVGHALEIIVPKKNWKILQQLHQQYGPTFGFYMMGQPWVSTTDIDLLKLILLDEGHIHLDRAALNVPTHQFNESIFQVNGHRWQQARRSISPSLTNMKVKSANVTLDIENCIDKMAISLRKKVASAKARDDQKEHALIDVKDVMDRLASSMVLTIFYKMENRIDFDAARDEWVEMVRKAADDITNPVTYLSVGAPRLRGPCEWIQQFTSVGRATSEGVKIVGQAIGLKTHQERRKLHDAECKASESEPAQRGLIDTILDNFFDRKVSIGEIESSIFMLLWASVLTTADTLTCLLWLLAKNQQIQDKLRQVILERGIDDEYVMWCINESIRFHTAVPLFMGRILAHEIEHKGLLIPRATFVVPTIHGIHHDANIWPEPKSFKPDRWRDQTSFHAAQFLGFGLGPRKCPGGKLATQEIKLALRVLLTSYKLETDPTQTVNEWDFNSAALMFCTYDKPIMLRLIPVQGCEV